MTVYKNLNVFGTVTDIISENGKISAMGNTDLPGRDFCGRRAYPGLVDIHTHGIGGFDTMDAELGKLADIWGKNGTTTVFPTTMTVELEKIRSVLSAPVPRHGAKIAGFHLEGPYINEKYKGAQASENIRIPNAYDFAGFNSIGMITLAPELDGAEEFIRNSKAVISLGHTDADYDMGMAAAQAGARCITHAFNAMAPLGHRAPALIGAAFDTDMYIQVICDGVHIHPSVIRMLYRLFGADRMILISDSMRAACLADGEYELGGQIISVRDKQACTTDGRLAGSTSTLFDCVMSAISFGIPERDAFKMASETPARLMSLNCGKIEPGRDCDLIVLDNNNRISNVVINGEIFA